MGRSVTLATSRFCFDQNGDRSLSCLAVALRYCTALCTWYVSPVARSKPLNQNRVDTYHTTGIYSFVHAECGGDALMTGLALQPFLEVCMILYCCTIHTRRRARSTGSPMLHTGDAEKLFCIDYRICSFHTVGKSNDTQT